LINGVGNNPDNTGACTIIFTPTAIKVRVAFLLSPGSAETKNEVLEKIYAFIRVGANLLV
jgi:hypothetical protein